MSDSSDDLAGTVSWRELLRETEGRLEASGVSENPAAEAKWILEEVTGAEREEFVAALDGLATVRGVTKLDAMVDRRLSGEPIQYVLGRWAFRTLDLLVDTRVLIPRPETEEVAGLAIEQLARLRPDGGGTVVDLGTGSGAIGLSIAVETAASRILLTDASADAIAVARANLAGLGLVGSRVEIAQGSWFEAIPDSYRGECDVIISNPPYVSTSDTLPASVADWEPESALLAGGEGLDDLRHLVSHAGDWLRSSGVLILEMGVGQTEIVAAEARAAGYTTTIHHDYARNDRAVIAVKP